MHTRKLLALAVLMTAACSDSAEVPDQGIVADAPISDAINANALYTRKSATVAHAADQSWFAVANRDSGSITVFLLDASLDLQSAATFTVVLGDKSSEVSSVSAGHDDSYLLATLQYDQKVCRIDIAAGAGQTPVCSATGSEPTAVVTNRDGTRVFVANMVDGSIGVYDAALSKQTALDFSGPDGETQVHPFALLLVHEPGDSVGALYLTDFFAEKVSGKQEGADDSRRGVVYKIPSDASDLSSRIKIELPPLADTGFRIPDTVGHCAASTTNAGCSQDPAGSGAFPNQLSSITHHQGRIFVLSTCASPRGDVRFNMNVHSCVHAIDMATDAEIPALRLNIQERIKQQNGEKLFCTSPTDMACVEDTPFCYVACAASDLVMRLDYGTFDSATSVTAGIDNVANNLPTGKYPTGLSIVGSSSATIAFTNNENSRDVSIIDLRAQAPVGNIQAAPLPTNAKELEVLKGKDFFFTGRGRWSDGRWSSCGSCHWRGLTDNITWHFPTGPRQTISMDASFSKENVAPDALGNRHNFSSIIDHLEVAGDMPQRIFNWTAVRDEVADFELNTRGVSGGKGAIVDGADAPIDLANSAGGNNANNNGSTTELVKTLDNKDWLAINEYVKTIRSPRAKTNVPGDPANGATLFGATYGCASCHAGGSHTVSRQYYTLALGSATSGTLKATFFDSFLGAAAANLSPFINALDPNSNCTSDAECNGLTGACNVTAGKCRTPALGNEFAGSLNRPIDQHACVLRNVGTFEDSQAAQGGLELRKNMVATAQGAGGFNVPSLLNLGLGAPYLHNGQYETLAAFLMTDDTHRTLINNVAGMNQQQFRDLTAYLLSIDGATAINTIASADQLCQPQP